MTDPPPIYHEQQSNWLCAKLQEAAFSRNDLEQFASDLGQVSNNIHRRWWNPHRLLFKLGDYDINVLTLALESRGFDLQWFDARE
ncbi:Josephin-1, partial [Dimargaris cristalligena]